MYAIIQNGEVENVIVAASIVAGELYPGSVRIDDLNPIPGIGWTYSGGTFSPP